jgi:hypothetical protein
VPACPKEAGLLRRLPVRGVGDAHPALSTARPYGRALTPPVPCAAPSRVPTPQVPQPAPEPREPRPRRRTGGGGCRALKKRSPPRCAALRGAGSTGARGQAQGLGCLRGPAQEEAGSACVRFLRGRSRIGRWRVVYRHPQFLPLVVAQGRVLCVQLGACMTDPCKWCVFRPPPMGPGGSRGAGRGVVRAMCFGLAWRLPGCMHATGRLLPVIKNLRQEA